MTCRSINYTSALTDCTIESECLTRQHFTCKAFVVSGTVDEPGGRSLQSMHPVYLDRSCNCSGTLTARNSQWVALWTSILVLDYLYANHGARSHRSAPLACQTMVFLYYLWSYFANSYGKNSTKQEAEVKTTRESIRTWYLKHKWRPNKMMWTKVLPRGSIYMQSGVLGWHCSVRVYRIGIGGLGRRKLVNLTLSFNRWPI